jgi:hypothetical protein
MELSILVRGKGASVTRLLLCPYWFLPQDGKYSLVFGYFYMLTLFEGGFVFPSPWALNDRKSSGRK